ncbi:hypothetical protein [Williamsia muralis]|uniref:hypothetical protein n=1 Tax=Williamsia marianensis TaxID=85044 RepID=UPI003807057E
MLHTSKKPVAALATAGSPTARNVVDTANLTLDQGMILAQYEDDLRRLTSWSPRDLYNVTRQDADAKKIAAELLGGVDPIEALDGAAAERAQLIALAITCAAHGPTCPKTPGAVATSTSAALGKHAPAIYSSAPRRSGTSLPTSRKSSPVT